MNNDLTSINIGKRTWLPGTLLSPVPPVMVTCRDSEGKDNIITIAWAGTVCSEPPMLQIAIRPERHSFDIIANSKEFVVNIPDRKTVRETDLCGVLSGRDYDKFRESGLTRGRSEHVQAPIIMECPINIECKLHQQIPLGSHELFIAEIVGIQVSEHLINDKGKLLSEKAELIAYAHGHYHQLGKQIGRFGFSLKKR